MNPKSKKMQYCVNIKLHNVYFVEYYMIFSKSWYSVQFKLDIILLLLYSCIVVIIDNQIG